MKIGAYVGSFNPVHKGHIKVINYLLDNKILDKIIVVPTKNYWDKNNLIDINHRINMLKYYENNKIIINDILNKYQYTFQILNKLKSENDSIYLIIGSDNLPKFNEWKNIDQILENNIIVMNRDNINTNTYINNFKQKDKFIVINEFENINISSTKIRDLINKKMDLDLYLDEEVIEYIKNNNLYGG